MILAAYLEQPDAITVSALAKKMGLTRQAVYNYTKGATPTLKRALQIESFTEGKVTLYDWLEVPEPKTDSLESLF